MIAAIIALFATALAGGILGIKNRSISEISFNLTLTFAGAYLFAITIIQLLPALFLTTSHPAQLGIFVLAGFYLQQLLEYFTKGAEHGHLHHYSADHSHSASAGITLLIGLSIHSFLEGTLLGQTSLDGGLQLPLVTGIVLHKIPAAYAMMTILACCYKKLTAPLVYLLLFSFATPLGIWLTRIADTQNLLTGYLTEIIFAIVAGSFLHISTTIVFEGTPGHQIKTKKLFVSLSGAAAAIISNLVF